MDAKEKMQYIRFDENYGNYKLIPITESPYNHIKKPHLPHFISMMKYNHDQYLEWQKTQTLKGVQGGTTNRLWADFDSKADIKKAFQDCKIFVDRLKALGFKDEEIQITFSGNKGAGIIVETEQEFTIEQVSAVCTNLAKGLMTFDTSMYDHQRIFRLPFTKNEKTGLYKIPLMYDELDLDPTEVKKSAKSLDNFDQNEIRNYYQKSKVKLAANLMIEKKEIKKTVENKSAINTDVTPKGWKTYKAALLQGRYEIGERHSALMVLAATCRGLGHDEDIATAMCQVADAKHCKLTGDTPVTDLEDNIIPSIYSSTWKGGQYSPDNNPWLKSYCDRMGIKTDAESVSIIKIGDVRSDFVDYMKNIEANTVKTGIDVLDEAMPLTTGMICGVLGAPSSGKCLGKDTPVLMYDGTVKLVQNVKVGDRLMGDDSQPRNVLSTCTGREKMYRVEQQNGENYVVNESHILSVRSNFSYQKNKRIKKGIVLDINVLDFMNESTRIRKYFKGFKVGVEFSKKETTLDPYFIGLWLGDGDSNNQTVITSDREIVEYLAAYSTKFENHWLHQYQDLRSKAIEVTITNKKNEKNLVKEELRSLELIKNKHIPKNYLLNDRSSRLKLLAGLIDSDGHWSSSNHYEITFKNTRLANDVVFLCRSLGFKTTITKETKGCTYKGEYKEGEYNRIYINGKGLKEIPVLLERKKATSEPTREVLNTRIKIVPLEVDNYYGFEIDGNHRFLLGDFTVTHNTALALKMLKNTSENGVMSVFASLDMHRTRLFQKLVMTETKLDRNGLIKSVKEGGSEDVFARIQKSYENVYFYDRSAASVPEIRKYIERVQESTGQRVRFLMIDYFERLGSERSDDTAASKEVAGALQDLCNDLNICIVVLVQPNKFSLGGGPDSPLLNYSSIKGSSFMYQAFRSIISIWRPFFTPELKDNDRFLQMAILKNDLGEVDMFDFGWSGRQGEIWELSEEEDADLQRLLKEKKQKKDEDSNDNGSWG